MKDVPAILARAAAAEARGDVRAVLGLLDEAHAATDCPTSQFDILLLKARAEARLVSAEQALATYWRARDIAQRSHLDRLGEADLGIGMMLLDLGRAGEGLEAVRRAARTFRRAGNTFLRGCAETVLAGEAVHAGDIAAAERHLDVALDLLEASGEPRMISDALTLRAECLARQGLEAHAEEVLARAAKVASHVGDVGARRELQEHRRAVRHVIAEFLASQGDDGPGLQDLDPGTDSGRPH